MFPTPQPYKWLKYNFFTLSNLFWWKLTICSHGVMATRLTSNQKILGSTPSVSVFALTFLFSSHSPLNRIVLSQRCTPSSSIHYRCVVEPRVRSSVAICCLMRAHKTIQFWSMDINRIV